MAIGNWLRGLVLWGTIAFLLVFAGVAAGKKSPQELLASVEGLPADLRIAGKAGSATGLVERLGTEEEPLVLHSADGRRLGEVFRVVEGAKYQGFLLVTSDATGPEVSFLRAEWPLDSVAAEIEQSSRKNLLLETEVFLVADEGRWVVRLNQGTVERDLVSRQFDAAELSASSRRIIGLRTGQRTPEER